MKNFKQNEKIFDALYDNDNDLFEKTNSIASTTECTGLVPASPVDEQSVESYKELYNTHLSSNTEKANNDLQKVKQNKPKIND